MPRSIAILRQRNAYHLKYKVRRTAQKTKVEEKKALKDYLRRVATKESEEKAEKKLAARRLREDYELGPLAPWRDYDDSRPYGVSRRYAIAFAELPEHMRGELPRIVEGDRVVVLRGREAGQIGEVREIDEKCGTLTVQGFNKIEMEIPEDARHLNQGKMTQAMEGSISLDNVRLVAALRHPQTGQKRDVIVEHVDVEKVGEDPATYETIYSRWPRGLAAKLPLSDFLDPTEGADALREMHKEGKLTGEVRAEYARALRRVEEADFDHEQAMEEELKDVEQRLMRKVYKRLYEIPYPVQEEPARGNRQHDTRRMDLENPTFVPTLRTPPMPPSVIDELRSKYSRFRTRFTLEEEARDRRFDRARRNQLQMQSQMRTPTEELRALLDAKRKQDREARKQEKRQGNSQFMNDVGALLAARDTAAKRPAKARL